MNNKLYLLTNGLVMEVDFQSGLLPIGGAKSNGKKVPALKYADDYVVIARSGNDWIIHPLKGKSRAPVSLSAFKSAAIEDLILMVMPDTLVEKNSEHTKIEEVMALLSHFAEEAPLKEAIICFLRILISATGMEKGVAIAKDAHNKYEVFATVDDQSLDWISEALVKNILQNGNSVWVQNRIGTSYENSKSLMASGFLSVIGIPLFVRGQMLGAVLLGSQLPCEEVSQEQKKFVEVLAQMGALLMWFHDRDLKQKQEIDRLKLIEKQSKLSSILTASEKFRRELELARKIASTRLSVLIQGETGVGKELVAREIHDSSGRRGNFVAVNCGAIPENLIESILFGHIKGSFTGASSDQIGKFTLADHGTLFLDEIGDLPESLQVKLLRSIQESVIEPVGSRKAVKVDVRILCATHRNLLDLVNKGKFREDLYFRIAETVLSIPPLRERPEDIALLAASFLQKCSNKTIQNPAYDWLAARKWSGNIRELKSTIERAAALANGEEIKIEDFLTGLPESKKQDNWLGAIDLEAAKQQFVLEKIDLALQRSQGNRQRAAQLLGINARTLFRYLEKTPESDSRQLDHP